MDRVTGIGGIFFKARDPRKLLSWYQRHLGLVPERDHDEECEFGRFGWITDPEGNRVKLWEPRSPPHDD